MESAQFSISPQAFNVIIQGLSELPHKVSRAVIDDLLRQAEAIEQAAKAPAPAPAAEVVAAEPVAAGE